MSMQRPEVAQMGFRSLHVFFFFQNILASFNNTASPVYRYHVSRKKPIGIVVCFQKAPVLEMAMLLEVPK